jgi:hypothetical protein
MLEAPERAKRRTKARKKRFLRRKASDSSNNAPAVLLLCVDASRDHTTTPTKLQPKRRCVREEHLVESRFPLSLAATDDDGEKE